MDYHRYGVPSSMLAPPPSLPPPIGSLSSSGVTGGSTPALVLAPHPSLMFHYGGTVSSSSKAPPSHHLHSSPSLVSTSGSVYSKLPNTTHCLSSSSASSRSSVYPHSMGESLPPPPSSCSTSSPSSSSFAAALRTLAKHAIPGTENESLIASSKSSTHLPPSTTHPTDPHKKTDANPDGGLMGSEELLMRGFQPYRGAEIPAGGSRGLGLDINHPPPQYAPYHPSMYQHPLSHSYSRLEEQLYLERMGLLRPSPYASAVSALYHSHPYLPPHFGSDLMSPISALHPSSALLHERLKLEEDMRQREYELELRREREMERERSKHKHSEEEGAKRRDRSPKPVSDAGSSSLPVNGVREASVNHSLGVSSTGHYFGISMLTNSSGGQAKSTSTPYQPPVSSKTTTTTTSPISSDTRQLSSLASHPTPSLTTQQYPKLDLQGQLTKPSANFILPTITNSYLPPISIAPVPLNQSSTSQGSRSTTSVTYSTVLQSNSGSQASVVPSTKSRENISKQHVIIRPFEIGDGKTVTDSKLSTMESSTTLVSATQSIPHQNVVINSPLCIPFPSAVTNLASTSYVPSALSNSNFSLNNCVVQPGVSTSIAEKNTLAGTVIKPTDLLTSRPIPSVVAIPIKTEAKPALTGALWSPLAIETKTIPKMQSTCPLTQSTNSLSCSDSKSVNTIKKLESGVFSVVNLLPNNTSSATLKPVSGLTTLSHLATSVNESYTLLPTSTASKANISASFAVTSINTQKSSSFIPGLSSSVTLAPSNHLIQSSSSVGIKHEMESLKEPLTVTGTEVMKTASSHENSSVVSISQPIDTHLQMALNPFQLSVSQPQSSHSQMPLTHTQGSLIVTLSQSSISHPHITLTHPQTSISHPHTSILNSQILIPHPETSNPHPQTSLPHPLNSFPHPQTSLPHIQTALPHPQTSLPHIQTALPHPQTSLPHIQTSLPLPQTSLPHHPTSLTHSPPTPTSPKSTPNSFESVVKVPMVTRGQLLPPAEPVVPPLPPRSPVSLLDNRAKEEAIQKEIDKEESERIEEQKRKLQEALKALEEAHIQEMTSIPVKQEVLRKEKVDTPLRSRKEELRIKREEEKAAREEAKTRKEEARQKKEEGLRVIRSELKRKMIEERIGAQKRVVTILHKGPAAPLHVTKKKMCIFSSVGLVTHPEANEVLLKTCERRVALLTPLLSPSPSPPPISMDCTETLGAFLAPEEPATDLAAPEELREGREEFMSSMGLRKQTNNAKQYIEKEWECILDERLKRYNRNSKDGFRKSIAITLSARLKRRHKRKTLLSATVEGLKIFCEQGTDKLSSILTLPMNMSPEMIEKLSSRLPNALVVNNNGLLQPLNQINQPINIFNNTISSVYHPLTQVNQTINTSGYHINQLNQSTVMNNQQNLVNLPKTLNQPINTLIQPLNSLCQPIIQISQPINQPMNQSIIITSSGVQSKDNIGSQILSSGNVQQTLQSGVNGNGSVQQQMQKYSPVDPLTQNINGQTILPCNNGQPQLQNTNVQSLYQNIPGQPMLQNANGQLQLQNANGQSLLSVSDCNFIAMNSMQSSKQQTAVTSISNCTAATTFTSSQSVCNAVGIRPKTEHITSDVTNKTGSTSTALAHKRALVSQFEHDNLLSNLPALDNVVEHFVKAAQEGGGSSTALSEHIAGVRRCQSALINTAQLVQEHVTQLMIARQQFDAQKFALHQHLSSITSLLTPEDNKQSRVYKSPDVSKILHPGCPISNTTTCDSEQKPLAVSINNTGTFSAHSLANIKSEGSAPISTFSQGVPINSGIKTEIPFNNTYYNNSGTYAPLSSDNVFAINNLTSLPNTNNKDSAIAPLSNIGESNFAPNHSAAEIILQPFNIKAVDSKTPLKAKVIPSVILSPSIITQPISHYPMHVSTTQVTASNYSNIASIATPPLSATVNTPIGGVSSSNIPLYPGPTNLIKPFNSNLLVTSSCNNVLSTRAAPLTVGPSITSSFSTVSVIHNLPSTANKSNILPVNAAPSAPSTEKLVNSESVYFLQQVSAKKSNELDSGCSFLKTIKPINQSHVKKSAKHTIAKVNHSREFVPNHLNYGSKKQALGVVSSKISPLPLYKHHQAPPSVGRVFNPSPASASAGVSANSKFGLPSQAMASKVAHSSLLKSPKSGSKVAIGFTPYSSIKQTKNYGAI